MWDEEDNNPYGSFNQDATADNNPALSSSCQDKTCKFYMSRANACTDTEQAGTPPSSQGSPQRNPAFYSQHADLSEDEHEQTQSQTRQRKDGYDGRIQQILYENVELEILITDAGKSPEGNFIAYRIRTGVGRIQRTYTGQC